MRERSRPGQVAAGVSGQQEGGRGGREEGGEMPSPSVLQPRQSGPGQSQLQRWLGCEVTQLEPQSFQPEP